MPQRPPLHRNVPSFLGTAATMIVRLVAHRGFLYLTVGLFLVEAAFLPSTSVMGYRRMKITILPLSSCWPSSYRYLFWTLTRR